MYILIKVLHWKLVILQHLPSIIIQIVFLNNMHFAYENVAAKNNKSNYFVSFLFAGTQKIYCQFIFNITLKIKGVFAALWFNTRRIPLQLFGYIHFKKCQLISSENLSVRQEQRITFCINLCKVFVFFKMNYQFYRIYNQIWFSLIVGCFSFFN